MSDFKDFNGLSQLALSELQAVFSSMSDDSVRGLLELIKKAPRIFLIGAGREGLATKSFAMRLTHLGKETYWIWDDTTPAIGQGDLMICACGSADVGHVNHVVNMAKESGATIALVTASIIGTWSELPDISNYYRDRIWGVALIGVLILNHTINNNKVRKQQKLN